MDVDTTTNIATYVIQNCIFNTEGPNYKTVNYKLALYTSDNVQNGTGGWFGVNCTTNWPLWISTNASSWSLDNLTPATGSPAIAGGEWVFRASTTISGTTLTITNAYYLDPTRVFRVGDSIRIENTTDAKVVAITGNSLSLDRSMTWTAGAGVWFNYSGTPLIGAAFPELSFPPVPTGIIREGRLKSIRFR